MSLVDRIESPNRRHVASLDINQGSAKGRVLKGVFANANERAQTHTNGDFRLPEMGPQRQTNARKREQTQTTVRDAETTILIKFAFWRGLGRGKNYRKLSKTLFFLGNSMTIKFGNFANFIVRNFVVIWEAPKPRTIVKSKNFSPFYAAPFAAVQIKHTPIGFAHR